MRVKVRGQSTVEMTFVMVAICLLAYGMINIFRWVGMDLGERRYKHEAVLTNGTNVIEQLDPEFYRPKRVNSAVKY